MTTSKNQNPFTSLDDALSRTFRGAGKSEVLQRAKLNKALDCILDGKLRDRAVVSYFHSGKLSIKTTSPVWRYELELRKSQIIEEINLYYGQIIVEKLQIT